MDDFDDLMEELRQKRDELRVQMNLASRELKEEWEELEEKMQDFSRRARLRETGEGVGDALGQLGNEIKQGYKRLWRAMRED
jgi:chromosome segregation ATPase